MAQIVSYISQIRVTLQGVDPSIWRRLLIPRDLFLHDLHKVLQTAMGWENRHVHLYRKGRKIFGITDDEWMRNPDFQDYTIVRVNDMLRKPGDEMVYIYDMGDNWKHTIVLEKDFLNPDPVEYYPLCIGGARECPPEDCGGPQIYMDMVSAVKNPDNPHYNLYKDLLPEGMDPEYFDVDEINEYLLEDDYGCMLPFGDDD